MALNGRDLSPLEPLVHKLEGTSELDAPATLLSRAVRGLLEPGAVKDALSGTWLGHALHPMLTDVVIGSFLSATALDLLTGEEGDVASRRLIALGLAAFPPTALSGASDWIDAEVDDRVKRVGIVHAAGNWLTAALYATSLAARRAGARRRGVLIGFLGAGTLLTGGYLGGHLSMRRAIGPDQTAYDPGPDDWTSAEATSSLVEGQPTRVVVDDTPVLLLKTGEQIYAIHDRCSHRGCSLSEGEIEGHEVVCGCHFSRFDIRDGAVRKGPATAPQPAFDVRQSNGMVEIRRRPEA